MLQVVEMPDIVALELEARAVAVAGLQDELDILEGIAEHQVARVLQMPALPVVLEGLVLVEKVEETEVHRAHVERGDLRLEGGGRPNPLLDGHVGAAACRDVDDRIGLLLEDRKSTRLNSSH